VTQNCIAGQQVVTASHYFDYAAAIAADRIINRKQAFAPLLSCHFRVLTRWLLMLLLPLIFERRPD